MAVTLTTPPTIFPTPSYEHVSRAGDFCFLAGQISKDRDGDWIGLGDPGAQAEQIYRNIGHILDHIGASPTDVCKVTTILTNRAHAKAVSAVRFAFFGSHRPPHTGMIIAGLGSPEVLLEVEMVVYLPIPLVID